MVVLDDGWFGKRNDITSSLGDWTADLTKFPTGIKGLAQVRRHDCRHRGYYSPMLLLLLILLLLLLLIMMLLMLLLTTLLLLMITSSLPPFLPSFLLAGCQRSGMQVWLMYTNPNNLLNNIRTL